MSALELRLADETLDRLLSWFPCLADPSDVEVDGEPERGREDESPTAAGAVDSSFTVVFRSALRYLRERDEQFAATRYQVVPAYELIDAAALEQDGRVYSSISATIGDPKHGGFGIELGIPFDVRWVSLLGGLTVRDRVRLLTEIVRVFGNVVRFAGLPDSVRSELIRGLREPVGLLRSAVRDAREHPSDEADGARAADTDPRSSDLIHANSVGEGER